MVDVRKAAVRGALWNYGVFLLSKVAVFATTVVLARLLTPEIYGVMALALAIITYVDALNEFGISAAVIYLDDDEVTSTTAFWLSLATGTFACATVFLAAPILGDAFGVPDVVPVMRVLALSFVIVSLGSVHEARLRRRLAFARRVVPELCRSALKGGVSIGLALAGWGIWSLVAGQIAAETIATLGYWLMLRWWPFGRFDRAAAGRIVRYGSQTMLVTFLGVVVRDVDYLIVAAGLGASALGFYTLGFRVPDLVLMGVCYAISQTLFPVLTRFRHDRKALSGAYCRSLSVLTMVTLPLGVGLFLVAVPFVSLVYGGKWADTAPVLQLISLYFVFQTIQFVSGDVYKAIGRQKILVAIALLRIPIAIPLLIALSHDGIVAVAAGQLALSAAFCSLQLTIASRLIGVRAPQMLGAMAPAILGSAAMLGSVGLMRSLVDPSSALADLVLTVLVGAAAYVVVAGLTGRSTIRSLRNGLLARRPVTAAAAA